MGGWPELNPLTHQGLPSWRFPIAATRQHRRSHCTSRPPDRSGPAKCDLVRVLLQIEIIRYCFKVRDVIRKHVANNVPLLWGI
jgi:hypothetical protein